MDRLLFSSTTGLAAVVNLLFCLCNLFLVLQEFDEFLSGVPTSFQSCFAVFTFCVAATSVLLPVFGLISSILCIHGIIRNNHKFVTVFSVYLLSFAVFFQLLLFNFLYFMVLERLESLGYYYSEIAVEKRNFSEDVLTCAFLAILSSSFFGVFHVSVATAFQIEERKNPFFVLVMWRLIDLFG